MEKKVIMFNIIKNISEEVKDGRTAVSIMLAVAEETGELATEVKAQYIPGTYKVTGVDGILGEGADVLITVLDLLIHEGYTEEQVLDTIRAKTTKWKTKVDARQEK